MNIQSVLIGASGADAQLLEHCSVSDRLRFITSGALILLTSLIAWFSLTFALNYIFVPSSSRSWIEVLLNYPLTLLVGGCWFLVVFNLLRFIVSSTGSGDGRSGIAWDEVRNSWFLWLWPLLLAFCLTGPIAVMLLHDEIISVLSGQQRENLDTANRRVDLIYQQEMDDLYLDRAKIQGELATIVMTLKGKISDTERMILTSKQSLLKSEEERKRIDTVKLRAIIDHAKRVNETTIRKMDSLVNETLKVFEQHPALMLMIGVFMFLTLSAPVVLKLLWVKDPYEFRLEFQNQITIAKYGIEPRAEVIRYKGQDYPINRFSVPERMLLENKARHDTSRKLMRKNLLAIYTEGKMTIQSGVETGKTI
ncbi:MAG: DUF4407 domain-containing protein [Gallionella sp.]|nr:DUF4407 domain-containing protein [Gallionella sp.]